MSEFRTPLSRARGWGASADGTRGWWIQRLTSLALLPLAPWFCFSLAMQSDWGAASMSAWIARPLNTILLVAFIIILCWHIMLGLRVIIEDYVHGKGLKFMSLIGVDLLAFAMAVSGVWAVLRISLSGAHGL